VSSPGSPTLSLLSPIRFQRDRSPDVRLFVASFAGAGGLQLPHYFLLRRFYFALVRLAGFAEAYQANPAFGIGDMDAAVGKNEVES
jgi:hypothetical protein